VEALSGVQADLRLGEGLGDPAVRKDELRARRAQQRHVRQVAPLVGARQGVLDEYQPELVALGLHQEAQRPAERVVQRVDRAGGDAASMRSPSSPAVAPCSIRRRARWTAATASKRARPAARCSKRSSQPLNFG
jgi:hypothetical protein